MPGLIRETLNHGEFSVIPDSIGGVSIVCADQVDFDSFDEATRVQARAALRVLEGNEGRDVTLNLGGALAQILRRFMKVGLDAGGVAYGPLHSEVSPEQAGKILGISRPLVVQRMRDGRLPFHYVGSHRRCSLKDVLELKAKQDQQESLMREMYEQFDDLAPGPRA